jgi:hypothetical protein
MRLITKKLGQLCARECLKDRELIIQGSSDSYRLRHPRLFGDLFYYHVPEQILYVKVLETTHSQYDFYLINNHAADKE